jgi:RNA-directed DNA polymerase
MSEERQKTPVQLALPSAGGSEASESRAEGTEALRVGRNAESPAHNNQHLMEEICERENLRQALHQVRANQGSPGIDGMTVDELPEYLKQHWPAIREQLLSGTYEPQPVKRVEIAKPDGGVRKLGIPMVVS